MGSGKDEYQPWNQGFDSSVLFSEIYESCNPSFSYRGFPGIADDDEGQPQTGTTSSLLVDHAIDFINDSSDPFFVNLWLWAPHNTPASNPVCDNNGHPDPASCCNYSVPTGSRNPFAEGTLCCPSFPTETLDLYSTQTVGIPLGWTRGYFALMTHLDDQLARLVEHLDDIDKLNNTWIIVSSDNGGVGINPALTPTNWPFSGIKGSLFEGGIRVPMIVAKGSDLQCLADESCTLQADLPRTFSQPVTSTDLLPTLAELSGQAPGDYKTDGVSFADIIDVAPGGTPGTPTDRMLVWEYRPRNTYFPSSDAMWLDFAIQDWKADQSQELKLMYRAGAPEPGDPPGQEQPGSWHLFDLSTDKEEKIDLYNDPSFADDIEDLYAKYLHWRRDRSEIPLSLGATRGNIDVHDRDMVLASGSDIGHLMFFPKTSQHDVFDGNFVFVADIKAEAIGTRQLLAEKPTSWQLWLLSTGAIELVVFEKTFNCDPCIPVSHSFIGTHLLTEGELTRVAFTLNGWKTNQGAANEQTVVRLFVGEAPPIFSADQVQDVWSPADTDPDIDDPSQETRLTIGGNWANPPVQGFIGSMYDIDVRLSSMSDDELALRRAPIFHDSFEQDSGGLGAWDQIVGTPTVSQSAAKVGFWGLEVDALETLRDNLTATNSYQMKVKLDPTGSSYVSPQRIIAARDGSSQLPFFVEIQGNLTNGYEIRAFARVNHAFPWRNTGWQPLVGISGASSSIDLEVDWIASEAGLSNGSLELRIDDAVSSINNIDNEGAQIDQLRLGHVAGASNVGTTVFDHFKSYR